MKEKVEALKFKKAKKSYHEFQDMTMIIEGKTQI